MTIQDQIAAVPRWRHRIQLPDGVTTPGSQDTLAQLPSLDLPESLAGLTVLDVGCSDGFYSFEAERRGAARVLAVDNYSSVYIDNPSGFDLARGLLGSKVEFLRSDLFDLDPRAIGQFDVVLFLGVLYHLRHPLLAMEHLARLCRRQLIMETAIAVPPEGVKARLLELAGVRPGTLWMEFYPSGEVNHDPTTWWAPTAECAEAMLRSCGFCGVTTASISGNRGVFHGFSPRDGGDAAKLLGEYGDEATAAAVRDVTGAPPAAGALLSSLRELSIAAFGRVRQELAERRAKQWHQHDRWHQRTNA